MLTVKEFYKDCLEILKLQIVFGEQNFYKKIKKTVVHRPGLALAGFLENFSLERILVFGQRELKFLSQLDAKVRTERINYIISKKTPLVLFSRNEEIPKEILDLCVIRKIPIMKSPLSTAQMLSKIFFYLNEKCSPFEYIHGTLVEVFGMGVLIKGNSSVGKSEAALGLLKKGHRLIADDAVKIQLKGSKLVGSGPELTRHLMEIRGIGIINVAHLFGAICVRPKIDIDLVVKLEEWNEDHFYDRVGLDCNFDKLLGISVPYYLLPVKPGRDVILLIETISLNHRSKEEMGYNSAKEFSAKLIEKINNDKKDTCETKKNY